MNSLKDKAARAYGMWKSLESKDSRIAPEDAFIAGFRRGTYRERERIAKVLGLAPE